MGRAFSESPPTRTAVSFGASYCATSLRILAALSRYSLTSLQSASSPFFCSSPASPSIHSAHSRILESAGLAAPTPCRLCNSARAIVRLLSEPFWRPPVLDRFEPACLLVEVPEIAVHKADQPNLVAHLFDTNALAGEDDAEIDLAAIEADAAACGHGGGSIVERILELRQTSVGSG